MREPDILGIEATFVVYEKGQEAVRKDRWRGWRLAFPEVLERPEIKANLGNWMVYCPGVSVAWSCWQINLIHLRDMEGVAPAAKKYPGAMYEIAFRAINPEPFGGTFGIPDPDDVEKITKAGFLEPIDFLAQFDLGPSEKDHTAKHILDLTAKALVGGYISPDESGRSVTAWALQSTIAHFISGEHKAPLPT